MVSIQTIQNQEQLKVLFQFFARTFTKMRTTIMKIILQWENVMKR